MADDVNKAGGRVNSAGSRIDSIGAGSRGGRSTSIDDVIKQARESISRPIAQMRQLQRALVDIREQKQNLKDEMEFVLQDEGSDDTERASQIAQITQELGSLRSSAQGALGSLRGLKSTTRERVEARVGRAVNRFVSPDEQESRIRGMSRESGILEMATREAGAQGYVALEMRRRQLGQRAAGIASQIEEAHSTGAPNERISDLGKDLSNVERQAAVAERGMGILRKQGFDPESQLMRIQRISAGAFARQREDEILSKASSDPRSMSDIQDEISKVTASLRDLRDQFDQGKISLEEFNDKAGQAANKFEDLSKEERATAGAGGRGLSAMAGIAQFSNMIGSNMLRHAQATQVDQRLTAINAASGIAKIQNDQFAMMDAAMRGDQSALGFLMGGGTNIAGGFQQNIMDAQQDIVKGQVGMSGLGAFNEGVMGMFGFGRAAKMATGGLKGKMAAGMRGSGAGSGGFTGNMTDAAIAYMDVQNQATSGQAGVAAYSSMQDLIMQMDKVPAAFRQSYTDFTFGMSSATLGAGSQAEAIMSIAGDKSFAGMLRSARISPEQFQNMMGAGIEAMGSDAFGSADPFTLRTMEKAGLGSMSTNLSRAAQLGNAGAERGTESLKSIMEEAISRGFDNSKAVGILTDATVQMAQRSGLTGLGIDATGGIGSLLMRATGGNDPNRSFAQQITEASTAVGALGGLLNTQDTSLANMERMSAFSEVFSNETGQLNATMLTPEDLELFKKATDPKASDKDKQAAEMRARGMGMAEMVNQDGTINKAKFDKVNKAQRTFFARGGNTGIGYLQNQDTQQQVSAIMDAIGAGEIDPTSVEGMREIENKFGRDAANAFFGTGSAATGGKASVGAMANTFSAKNASKESLDEFERRRTQNNTQVRSADEARTQGAVADALKLEQGAGQIGSAEGLRNMMKPLEKMMTEDIEKWVKAASSAVDNMTNNLDATTFKNLATETQNATTNFAKLNTVLGDLLRNARINTDPSKLQSVRTDEVRRAAEPERGSVKR